MVEAIPQAAGRGTRQIVVDLGSAHFWDCSGLHALADFTRGLSAAGRACRIVGALPATRRLIGMANLAERQQLDGVLDTASSAGWRAQPVGVPARRPVSGHPLLGALATAGRGR